ncbi:MAG: bifunctional phosphopantothenoylcysteine decarboxylase/phosphopantothenate--cysteine ligase CoaBC [Christensenellaceae bacterium]|jgi:phosphopantothenoylcysteine decarboxylase/phosphopantothenate--cysteine ligase|nr:bifunctional phosphopantothenoylcysteine decarboxylase/phosphopantothenate--cysteine ligase CoaBC [Christensenellaceae bacterium]
MARKTIILGITGGIAVYKACELVSRFVKADYDVRVIATKNALEFVTPLTFETLSKNRLTVDVFDKDREYDVEHISYAKLASAFIVAPATANFIAKFANGIADDMLTTTIMATHAPIIIAPAMNSNMYLNDSTKANISILKQRGVNFVGPVEGRLACGDVGIGKMSEPSEIFEYVDDMLTPSRDYRGLTAIVTAGATREPIDAVRYISNRSSGKMGVAIAEAIQDRGGKVIFIKGNMTTESPKTYKTIGVQTTEEMLNAVLDNLDEADIIIKAAAPSDYKVENYQDKKIKANTLTLNLVKNPDIAKRVGQLKGNKTLVVFAAETDDVLENAFSKLESKNADIVVANDVTLDGAGFDSDTNIATIITKDGVVNLLECMPKRELADEILNYILGLRVGI